jgi:hypothetical protein
MADVLRNAGSALVFAAIWSIDTGSPASTRYLKRPRSKPVLTPAVCKCCGGTCQLPCIRDEAWGLAASGDPHEVAIAVNCVIGVLERVGELVEAVNHLATGLFAAGQGELLD